MTHQRTVVQLPPPPAPVRAATVRPTYGHWRWVPSMQSYTWVADSGVAPAPLLAQVVDISFYEKLVAWAKENKIWVVSDLAYSELYFDGK